LDGALVALRRSAGREGPEIAAPAGLRIFLTRVEAVLPRGQFANHRANPQSVINAEQSTIKSTINNQQSTITVPDDTRAPCGSRPAGDSNRLRADRRPRSAPPDR